MIRITVLQTLGLDFNFSFLLLRSLSASYLPSFLKSWLTELGRVGFMPALPGWACIQSTVVQQRTAQRQVSQKACSGSLWTLGGVGYDRWEEKARWLSKRIFFWEIVYSDLQRKEYESPSRQYFVVFFTHSKWSHFITNFVICTTFLKKDTPQKIFYKLHAPQNLGLP